MTPDTPAHFVLGRCWSCGRSFTFHPEKVPSIPVGLRGVRQPICRECATTANAERKARNLPLWDVTDDAYGVAEGLPE